MTAIPFDTLKFAEATSQELATKADMLAIRNDMQLLERDLKIWFGKMMAWQLTAVAGLLAVATAVVKPAVRGGLFQAVPRG